MRCREKSASYSPWIFELQREQRCTPHPHPFGCWISKPEILCLHAYNDNLVGSLNDLRLTLSWWKDLKHVSSVFFVNWNTTLQFFLPQIESFQINLCDLLTFWAGSQSFSIFLQSSWGRSVNEKSPIPHIACRWVMKMIFEFLIFGEINDTVALLKCL